MPRPTKTRFSDHHSIAEAALDVCVAVREIGPLEEYMHLTAQCCLYPERMAQILMCLAVWIDMDAPASQLADRAEAVAENRVRIAGRRVASA